MAPNHKRASSDEQEQQETPSGPDSPFDVIWDEAQRRLPPTIADQLRQGRDALEKGVGAVQAQIERRTAQADVDALTRRIDQLTKQVEELAARQKGNDAAPKRSRTKPTAAKGEAKPATKRRAKKQDAGSDSTD